MKKTDVLAAVSSVRAACQMANACLRSTGHRMAKHGTDERGPDPKKPWLVPLTPEERTQEIIQAVLWSRSMIIRANKANTLVEEYARQNDITEGMIQAWKP